MGIIHIGAVAGQDKILTASIERLVDGLFREADSDTFTADIAYIDLINEGGLHSTTVDAETWDDGLYLLRIHDTGAEDAVVQASTFGVRSGYEVSVGGESPAFDVYHADIQFVKDQMVGKDEYTVTWFKNGIPITTGITDATLRVVNRTDGTDLLPASPMTEIGDVGTFKFDVSTGTQRQTGGENYLVIASATIDGVSRTFSTLIGRDVL